MIWECQNLKIAIVTQNWSDSLSDPLKLTSACVNMVKSIKTNSDLSHDLLVLQGQQPFPNPHGDPIFKPLMHIQHQVAEILYGRSVYVKKIIEEANSSEETAKLLKVW